MKENLRTQEWKTNRAGYCDTRLREILDRSGLPHIDPVRLEQTGDWNLKLLQEKCMGRRVALWGAGEGNEQRPSRASYFLSTYGTYLQGTVCLIDSNPRLWGSRYLGLPVIAPQEIRSWGIECIVISASARWQDEIEQKCLEYLPQEQIVRPNLNMASANDLESNLYLYMHSLRMGGRNSQDEQEKEECLRKLISCHLEIRDFAFAFREMDEYIRAGYPGSARIRILRQELELLLQEMKDAIAGREKDVLVFFADRLNRRECESIGMFSCMRQDSLYFTDANSTGLYTYESMASILRQWMPLEKSLYEMDLSHPVEEVPFIRKAMRQDYRLFVESCLGYPIFKGEGIICRYSAFASVKLWNYLVTLCENKEKVFTYLYVYESHVPELCGYHPDSGYDELLEMLRESSKYYRKYYLDCLRYIDSVFSFYYSLFPKDMRLVVHSDHSFLPSDDEAAAGDRSKLLLHKEYCVEVPLIIKGFPVTGEFSGQFSMLHFTELMEQLLDGESPGLEGDEIIRYQMHPVHSKTWRAELAAQGLGKYMEEVDVYVSADYICMILGRKDAEVYRRSNIYADIAGTEEGLSFLRKVKGLA